MNDYVERDDGGFAFRLPTGKWMIQRRARTKWALREWVIEFVDSLEEALRVLPSIDPIDEGVQ